MVGSDVYRFGNIQDVRDLIDDTVKKRNEFYKMLENEKYPDDIRNKIKNQEPKLSISIFTPYIVAKCISSTLMHLRQLQKSQDYELVKYDNLGFILGATYYFFGEVCSLCRQVLMAQLIKSETWNIDTSNIVESKLISPKDNSFSFDDLKIACNRSVLNDDVFKQHLINEHKSISEINRYILSFLLYQ